MPLKFLVVAGVYHPNGQTIHFVGLAPGRRVQVYATKEAVLHLVNRSDAEPDELLTIFSAHRSVIEAVASLKFDNSERPLTELTVNLDDMETYRAD